VWSLAGSLTLGLGGGIAALIGMGDAAIASSLGVAKAKNTFGDSFPQMEKRAKDSAHAMGMTKLESYALGAGIQDFLVPMGIARKDAADMTASAGVVRSSTVRTVMGGKYVTRPLGCAAWGRCQCTRH
jgi:hypothetical protein